jgi:hypothetical protein
MTGIEEIPRICFVQDVARALRLPAQKVRFRTKYHLGPLPPLPAIDGRVRYSGDLLRWLLTTSAYDVARFQETLEQLKKVKRKRRPWFEFGPPYSQPLAGAARDKEQACVTVRELAAILRMSESSLRKAATRPDIRLPPATWKPLGGHRSRSSAFWRPRTSRHWSESFGGNSVTAVTACPCQT